ncbi:basic salivary proline-rich protein 1-like [Oryx dammah]|uniref:basic salivary proline-rich protein 1-like n=1 Tax=Oryx dammah TaxID=59534 RepID=UPI001A9B94CA|nr:basic salivary proline-rich protein 1-like [Oryx dammah]
MPCIWYKDPQGKGAESTPRPPHPKLTCLSPSVPQRNPTPVAVEKRLGLHHVPQRDPKLPGAEKGPKTQVPPAGFLRPGIRRHKGPAGRGPRWQGQGLSRRRNALRPPRAERGPPGARVASLSGQAPYTWGPEPGGSVSARGDPRTLPGRAPVPRLYQANTIVQARNPSSVCDRGRIGHGKVPSRTFYRCLSPRRAERRDPGRGERTRAQPSPPGEARGPGPPLPSRSGRRAPRGVGLGQVGPGPHLTWNPRPAPARGLRVLLQPRPPAPLAPPRARRLLGSRLLPAHLRRGEQGSAAVEAGAPSRRPREGGTALGPIHGSVPPGGGAPARVNMHEAPPARPQPHLRSPWTQDSRAAPSVPPPPGGGNSSRNARLPRATSQARLQRGAVPPTTRPRAAPEGGAKPCLFFLKAPNPIRDGDRRTQGQVSRPES